MSDDNPINEVTNVIQAASEFSKSPLYNDAVQAVAKEVGKGLCTIGQAINLALEPIRGMIWSYETIKNFFVDDVKNKLKNILPEDIVTPKPNVAVPAIEALRYTGYEENLREMYANLLANAMDNKTKNDAHPSFVEVIKQLTAEEAKLLVFLSEIDSYPIILRKSHYDNLNVRFTYVSSGISFNDILQSFKLKCKDLKFEINFNSAIDNLMRLQIMSIESTVTQSLKNNHDFGFNRGLDTIEKIEFVVHNISELKFTSYGIQFVNICIKNKA